MRFFHSGRLKKIVLVDLIAALFLSAMTTSYAATVVAWGSTGTLVTKIQQKLRQYGYMTAPADGVFGKATYDAVVYFQKKNGLTADGVVGSSTAAALGVSLSSSSSGTASASSGSSTSRSEVDLLARAVHAEARGEPYIGKVAVAAVILNRVKSASFPNTIAGVVYQPGAFTAVNDGQINLTPDSESVKAAQDAMNGWDPSGGCLYYYNPKKAISAWIFSRPIYTVIGSHNFCM